MRISWVFDQSGHARKQVTAHRIGVAGSRLAGRACLDGGEPSAGGTGIFRSVTLRVYKGQGCY